MPIEVDAEQRKRDVVEAATRLIVAGGLEAVTFRNLARELGCSTTVISHYFDSKSEVLRATYLSVMSRAERRRRESHASGRTGLMSLEEILPIGEDRGRDWVVWICFWNSALFDPKLAAEHKLRLHRAVGIIESALRESGASGPGVAATAQAIMTVVYGIAVQAVFDREYWTPERQRKSLRQALKGLGVVLSARAGHRRTAAVSPRAPRPRRS